MMRKIVALVAIVSLSLCVEAATSSATSLGNGLSGKKRVKLSNEVGANEIKFTSSAPLEDIHGSTNGIKGELELNLDNLEQSSGRISVEVESMKTGIRKRDKHLQSSDWLDMEQFPHIIFELKNIQNVHIESNDPKNGKTVVKATAHGAFTLHGVTVTLSIPCTITYIKESERTKKRAPGDFVQFQGNFSIALKDYNIKGKAGIVGSKVGESIDLQAVFFGSTAL